MKISAQSSGGDRGAFGYGDNRALYLALGFGVLTSIVAYTALEDDTDPSSP